jgi:hypothetical protein
MRISKCFNCSKDKYHCAECTFRGVKDLKCYRYSLTCYSDIDYDYKLDADVRMCYNYSGIVFADSENEAQILVLRKYNITGSYSIKITVVREQSVIELDQNTTVEGM